MQLLICHSLVGNNIALIIKRIQIDWNKFKLQLETRRQKKMNVQALKFHRKSSKFL